MEEPMKNDRPSEQMQSNWSQAFDFMHSQSNPIVKSMLFLVYEQFVHLGLEKRRPPGFDLLFCFQMLAEAFSQSDALSNAVKGDYGKGLSQKTEGEIAWVPKQDD